MRLREKVWVAMRRTRSRRPSRATLVRRWSAVAAVVVVGYFYYHPLRAYFSTRDELHARRTEVARLAAEKRELTRRLSASESMDVVAREARRLGYVRRGEHLFIVKGIGAWRRAHTIARDGK